MMTIVMADDDKDDFILLEEAMERAGLSAELIYSGNWLELWRQLMKAVPDILFLDINMPVKNGIECLQLIREDRKLDTLPVIMYTTSTNRSDIENAYAAGANYYAVKPNSIDDIAKMLKKIFSMHHQTLLARPPREEFVII